MSRDALTQIDGVVTEVLAGGLFHVTLSSGNQVNAKLSGKLRKFHIRVLLGDKVSIGFSPYDLTHGLILSREKVERRTP